MHPADHVARLPDHVGGAGQCPDRLGPFGLVWGCMLVPTFIFWAAAVGLRSVITRNRYVVFALAAAC